jgi:hypothetical protein
MKVEGRNEYGSIDDIENSQEQDRNKILLQMRAGFIKKVYGIILIQ